MSQQINLYDPALLRQREWLTAANMAAASLALLAVVAAWGGWARTRLAAAADENAAVAPRLKALRDELVAVGRQIAEVRPSPQLADDLAAARAQLGLRGEIVAALKQGLGADAPGFAEYMRAFARQARNGLWLTGFSIGNGGAAVEIRGRMIDAALLPEYIRRLDGEKAFQGRAFAALKVSSAQPAPAAAGQPQPAAQPPYLEFVLTPVGDPSVAKPAETGRAAAAEVKR